MLKAPPRQAAVGRARFEPGEFLPRGRRSAAARLSRVAIDRIDKSRLRLCRARGIEVSGGRMRCGRNSKWNRRNRLRRFRRARRFMLRRLVVSLAGYGLENRPGGEQPRRTSPRLRRKTVEEQRNAIAAGFSPQSLGDDGPRNEMNCQVERRRRFYTSGGRPSRRFRMALAIPERTSARSAFCGSFEPRSQFGHSAAERIVASRRGPC